MDILNLKYPLIQAPMAGGPTTPELVAAVCNAGGLGSLGAGMMSASAIKKAIQQIRKLTDKPFAVNLFIPEKHHATGQALKDMAKSVERACSPLNIDIDIPEPPYAADFEAQMQVVLDEQVPILSFTFGIPNQIWRQKLKANNTLLIGTATSLTEARALKSAEIDMVVAQGLEAGGHRGTFIGDPLEHLFKTKTLVAELVKNIDLPIIAAGGIMTKTDIEDMLALGASAVQMGTAFLSTHEAGTNPMHKQALLDATDDHTVLTKAFSGKYARAIENKFIRNMQEQALEYPIQNALTKPMRQAAAEQYNPEYMSLWSGQEAKSCQELSAAELIEQLF